MIFRTRKGFAHVRPGRTPRPAVRPPAARRPPPAAPEAGAGSPASPVVPTNSSAPQPARLRGGSLRMLDIAAATMANIGPAMSFYFGFGFLATTAGVASPLTILAAGVAVA